jgi:hypothetical protein
VVLTEVTLAMTPTLPGSHDTLRIRTVYRPYTGAYVSGGYTDPITSRIVRPGYIYCLKSSLTITVLKDTKAPTFKRSTQKKIKRKKTLHFRVTRKSLGTA